MSIHSQRSIIVWLLVVVSCLGLLFFIALFSGGVLALQKLFTATASATVTASRSSKATHTPTLIQLPSPTKVQIPSPTAPLLTEIPFSTATLGQPSTDPVSALTQPLEGFVPGAWCVPWNSTSRNARVLRVIDGVTFEASIDNAIHQVRYLGLDLIEFNNNPEKWTAMTEKNRSLVEGKTVLLIEGARESLDAPLLRYVILDGMLINLELIKDGFAAAKNEPGNSVCQEVFARAQVDAEAAGRGLWAATPTPTRTLIPATATASSLGEVVIVNISKRGNGWQEPEEYVEIYNSGTESVQLKGWSVRDIENHIFWFPGFVLGPGQYCRVYTDQYWPKHCGFSFHNPAPIWDNTGDCAFLRDATGKLVDKFCYD